MQRKADFPPATTGPGGNGNALRKVSTYERIFHSPELFSSFGGKESQATNALFLDLFIEQKRTAPRKLVLDFDTSAFPTHGQQAFAFFNGRYDTYFYLPLFVFASVPGEGQEYPISAELRPCDAKEIESIVATLKRLMQTDPGRPG